MNGIARKSLAPLTGVRFLAAIWVVLYHGDIDFGFAYWFQPPSASAPRALLNLVVLQGYLAVDFFFLLSGFILAYNYIGPDARLRGGKRPFWIARFARIYPVYLLGIGLGLIEFVRNGHSAASTATTTALHLLLVQSWIPSALHFDLNSPAWSLAAEALFYALFPLLLPLCARVGGRRVLLIAFGSWVMFGLALGCCAVLGSNASIFSNSTWIAIASFNPLVRLPEFLVGLALGLAFVRAASAEQAPSRRRWRLRAGLHDAAVVVLVAAFCALCVVAPRILAAIPVTDVMGIVAIPIMAPLIYLLALERGVVARALSAGLVAWLGEISYGVYILHWPLWYLWSAYVTRMLPFTLRGVWSLIAYAVLLIAVAGLSFRYFEGPARRAIRAHWGREQPRMAPIAQPVRVG